MIEKCMMSGFVQKLEINTLANGQATRKMGTEHKYGSITKPNMKEIGKIIFLMDKEESQVQVVIFMKETGETEDFTEMQNLSKTHIPTEFQTTFLKANGKME